MSVLVVGGGPTGLAAANLLGAMGVGVLLVERNAGTSDEAKAISLDEESLRSLQLAGLDEAIYPIIVPGVGTKYFGARGQALVHARGKGGYRFGHPFKNSFAQPEFERVLKEGLGRFPHVTQRFSTALVGLEQKPDAVIATLDDETQVTVDYLLGCDGGRSTVRQLLSVPMTGQSFDDVWLVVDTVEDPHDERYGLMFGDPRRGLVIVPGREGRCRYEFALKPGEGVPGEQPPFELIEQLLRPHRSLTPGQVERAVNYRFHALLADRLREGRCFLLGDAAHMMPPFAGQGLNSGLRDAVNLSWKIASVLRDQASDALLDTYDTERRPHAQAMIDLSVRLGRVIMTTDPRRALFRDLLVEAAMRTRRGRRYFTEMRWRPVTRLRSEAVVPLGEGPDQELVGQMFPQPRVLNGAEHDLVRLDDVLGTGWSLIGFGVTDAGWATVGGVPLPHVIRVDVVPDDRCALERDGRVAVTDADGSLNALVCTLRGRFVLVRPDRLVSAVFTAVQAHQVSAALASIL